MITITWTNAQKKAANMNRLAKAVGTRHAQAWGNDVAEAGKESIRYSILSGGVNQTKKGGSRILSGAMFDSTFSDAKNNGGIVSVSAGYKRSPTWTKFQEFGTRDRRVAGSLEDLTASSSGSGIPAMLSIPTAIQDMEVISDDAGMKMLWNIAKEWNSSV